MRKGFVLLIVLVVFLGLSGVSLALINMLSRQTRTTGRNLIDVQAYCLALAGRAKARWALTTGAEAVGWSETNIPLGTGVYAVTTEYTDPPVNSLVKITSEGYVPDRANPLAHRQVIETDITLSNPNTNLAEGQNIRHSTKNKANSGWRAVDGNMATYWESKKNDALPWLRIDFGSATQVDKVVFYENNSNIFDYTIEYSDDDTIWVEVTYIDKGNRQADGSWTATFGAINNRYLRLSLTKISAKRSVAIYEWQTYYSVPTISRGTFVNR
jgi:hypothetical protein